MKKLLSVFISLVLLFTSLAIASSFTNADEGKYKFNGMDLLVLKKCIFGSGELSAEQRVLYDLNNDGKHNGMDLLLMKKIILGIDVNPEQIATTITNGQSEATTITNEPTESTTVTNEPTETTTVSKEPTNGLLYTLNEDKKSYSVSKGTAGNQKQIVIASEYNGLPVTEIGDSAFEECTDTLRIIIPDSIKKTGKSAFAYCNDTLIFFEGTSIPDTNISFMHYTWIMTWDFSVKAIIVPDEALSAYRTEWNEHKTKIYAYSHIVDDIFIIENKTLVMYVAKNETVIVPDTVEHIGISAFEFHFQLKSVTLPGNLKSIGNYAFLYCFNLTDINLPDGLINIKNNAFAMCTSLADVILPDSLTELGGSAFYDTNIKSIVIPDGIKEIKGNTFYYCKKLESVTLPKNLEIIDQYAFGSCTALKSIILPDTLLEIKRMAFYNTDIKEIEIPKNVMNIEPQSFRESDSLENISVKKENKTYRSEGNCIIRISDNTLIIGIDTSIIPKGIKHIDECAFYARKKIKTVIIPQGVETIGDNAFSNCSSLETVIMYEGVKEIGRWSFQVNPSLKSIIIPKSVEKIGIMSFYDVGDNYKIFYGGKDINEWKSIDIGASGNTKFINSSPYYYSAIKPGASGNYWRYDDNGIMPVIWN